MFDIFRFSRPIMGASLAYLVAMRRVGDPRPQQIYSFLLFAYPDRQWTISSLAEAAGRDRASVRKQLANMDPSLFYGPKSNLRLSEVGRTAGARRVVRFYRSISEPYRSALAQLFQGAEHRLIEVCELGIVWDALSRRSGREATFLAVMSSLFEERGAAKSVAQITEETTYSGASVYRTLSAMRDDGFVSEKAGKWRLTARGLAEVTVIIARSMTATDMKSLGRMSRLCLILLNSQSSHPEKTIPPL